MDEGVASGVGLKLAFRGGGEGNYKVGRAGVEGPVLRRGTEPIRTRSLREARGPETKNQPKARKPRFKPKGNFQSPRQ